MEHFARPAWTLRPREIAPWAADPERSRGRIREEPPCPMRTPYQRDRDRIVHATAFRRLNYKTQVFLLHEGDHYRSRLTHSLEVAQIARAIARQLGLDEDLAEALALAHDLGHPPFGHAGERALDRALRSRGGFDHNAQSLRVVTRLERKYWSFDGLNLTLETLEGLVKHNGPLVAETQPLLAAAVGEAGLAGRIDEPLEGPAEGQVAAIADDIAYNSHDIDDALRAGLLGLEELGEVPLVGRLVAPALARAGPGGDRRRAVYEVIRRMITLLIEDVLAASRQRIAAAGPAGLDDVRRAGRPLIGFSPAMADEIKALKAYLFARVYRHERVMRAMRGAETLIEELFALYQAEPAALPDERRHALGALDEAGRARAIADFVAGMTDRFAEAEHRRLLPRTPELR